MHCLRKLNQRRRTARRLLARAKRRELAFPPFFRSPTSGVVIEEEFVGMRAQPEGIVFLALVANPHFKEVTGEDVAFERMARSLDVTYATAITCVFSLLALFSGWFPGSACASRPESSGFGDWRQSLFAAPGIVRATARARRSSPPPCTSTDNTAP